MEMSTVGVSDQLTYQGNHQIITGGIDYYKDKIDNYFGTPEMSGKNVSNTAAYIYRISGISLLNGI
jgi:hypothetical protein